nr:helix-turn-helix transcriptional regulator [Nonlabens sp. Hel1_33_55]
MEHHDLNASSFAEQIGVGRSSISHILSGRNKPSLDFVLSILKNFDEVDLYWLLNGKGTYPKSKSAPIVENSNTQELTKEKSTTVNKSDAVEESDTDKTAEPIAEKSDTPQSHFLKKGKNISKVIWFYEDGTFTEFIPNP